MPKPKNQPDAPADLDEQQIASLLPALVPFLTHAASVSSYMKSHDRQMRDRGVVALERIADALEGRAKKPKKR